MIFKRKIYEKLLEWKKCEGSEALMIEGAPAMYSRGVGDTAKFSDVNTFCFPQLASSTIVPAADNQIIFFILFFVFV